MIILGTPIAQRIRTRLRERVQTEHLSPHLTIILANHDPASARYIEKKIRAAEKTGVAVTVKKFDETELDACRSAIAGANANPAVHGILVQLPVYDSWPEEELIAQVSSQKDVDGFLPESPYTEATAQGVWSMLAEFARVEGAASVPAFLKGKTIVVVGRGRTAGGPVLCMLQREGFAPENVNRETPHPDEVIRSADVLISAVGKNGIVNGNNTKPGAYVISVGIDYEERDGEQVALGDANEQEVSKVARLLCPTINGIGPLTVACLLSNLVEAASKTSKQ
jgi:methylenetetrahydrofolate dehydrogenase (NADP+)/methenyltetrahydrofolate cyclohydrolase